MQKVKARETFRTLREVVDHRAWGDLPPTVVNAFYEPSTNAICIILLTYSDPYKLSFLDFSFSSWYFTNAILQQRCTKVTYSFMSSIYTIFDFIDI